MTKIEELMQRLSIVETNVEWIRDHLKEALKNKRFITSLFISVLALLVATATMIGTMK